MALFSRPLLTTAYFPPVEYFMVLASAPEVWLEACENYQKQSYRTRCHIYASAGREVLQVPVCHGAGTISEVEIDYSREWLHQHKVALLSAYRSSPFFEYYWDEIQVVLDSRPRFLFELNTLLTETLLNLLNIRCNLRLTEEYVKEWQGEDFRSTIHPKSKEVSLLEKYSMQKPYYQIFGQRAGFIPNLSILDLLFHEGPQATDYLVKR